jgi:hypothetical protein
MDRSTPVTDFTVLLDARLRLSDDSARGSMRSPTGCRNSWQSRIAGFFPREKGMAIRVGIAAAILARRPPRGRISLVHQGQEHDRSMSLGVASRAQGAGGSPFGWRCDVEGTVSKAQETRGFAARPLHR